jgi:hypothetical protein
MMPMRGMLQDKKNEEEGKKNEDKRKRREQIGTKRS